MILEEKFIEGIKTDTMSEKEGIFNLFRTKNANYITLPGFESTRYFETQNIKQRL